MKDINLDNIRPDLHQFETLPTGEEALVRYDRVLDIPNMYQGNVVFTKEEFIMAYNRWIKDGAEGIQN
jgi:hypothetical protein